MYRRTTACAIAVASLVAWTVACLDNNGPRKPIAPGETIPGLFISAPVPLTRRAVTAPRPAASPVAGAGMVYVSLQPASVLAGVRATITNEATGLSVITPVVDGGFDPVPLAAGIGDTLVTDIAGLKSTTLDLARLAVSSVRPLKVVRTSPPSGGRDVPLNTTIVIVFSQPIDSAALSDGSIELLQGTTPVPGTLRFGDSSQLIVEFHPASLLASLTTYQLQATTAIRGVNGATLDSALEIPFTTGTASPIIAFHSNLGIEEIGADGLGRAVLIADSTAFQPAWSPDGARLAFTRIAGGGNACEIYTVRADGSDDRKITTPDTAAIRAGLSTWCAYFPAWSPDGTKIAFAAGPRGCAEAPYCWSFPGSIYVVNADGSNERQLFTLGSLPPPQYSNFHYMSLTTPMWSPDGSMIAFTGDATNGGDDSWWAYIGTAAGGSARRLTDVGLEGPTWSPDGLQIAGGGWVGITLLNLDGSIAAILTQFGWDVDPAWSPDGAHLVFTRWGTDSTGNASVSDLFIISRDGTGLRQLTTTGDASHPTLRSATPLPVPQP